MNKKEKYLEFIHKDLIKKTTITDKEIILPFDEVITMERYRLFYYNPYQHLPNVFNDLRIEFEEYAMDRYGVKREELEGIYSDYKRRMIWLVSSNW